MPNGIGAKFKAFRKFCDLLPKTADKFKVAKTNT
jgi:hypothetical protein